jgi:(p)ppGpp synthase/HD superfamily hydrolase
MIEPEVGRAWSHAMRAAQRASKWHAAEKHKGGKEPFINHLIEVATLVTMATEGQDPVLTSAAFLHDAIEKVAIEPRQIRDEFGEDVCDLVLEVTDDRTLTKRERRRHQVETAAQKSRKAKMLKLADKISNLRALALHEDDGGEEDTRDYANWAEAVAEGLRGTDPWLEKQFDDALAFLRQRIGKEAADRRTPSG